MLEIDCQQFTASFSIRLFCCPHTKWGSNWIFSWTTKISATKLLVDTKLIFHKSIIFLTHFDTYMICGYLFIFFHLSFEKKKKKKNIIFTSGWRRLSSLFCCLRQSKKILLLWLRWYFDFWYSHSYWHMNKVTIKKCEPKKVQFNEFFVT